jgi:hypothetical protein
VSNLLLRNALGTMLAGAAILMVLCFVSFGFFGADQRAGEFSQRLADYRDPTRNQDAFDQRQRYQQQMADGEKRSNRRTDARIASNPDEFDSNGLRRQPAEIVVPRPNQLPQAQENLPPLPPPVERIASGRLERLESRLDRVLDSMVSQPRATSAPSPSFDARTHEQITELRIQNQVELRDLQRRMQMISEHQDRMNQTMLTQRAEFAKTLAATDNSITKHIDRLVNAIPQRTAAYSVSNRTQGFSAHPTVDDHSPQTPACSDQLCPHCRRQQDGRVPQPKDREPANKADHRSAERVWMKPVSSAPGQRNGLDSNRKAAPKQNTTRQQVPQRKPIQTEETIETPSVRPVPFREQKPVDDTSLEKPKPRIAVEPDPTRTSYVQPEKLDDELFFSNESVVESAEANAHQTEQTMTPVPIVELPAVESPSVVETPSIPAIPLIGDLPAVVQLPAVETQSTVDDPSTHAGIELATSEPIEATYVPRIHLPSFNEPFPAPATQEVNDTIPGTIVEVAAIGEADRLNSIGTIETPNGPALIETTTVDSLQRESLPLESRPVPASTTPPILQPKQDDVSAEQPLKIRMSVIHIMANDVKQTLPAGVSSLREFVKKNGGWSDGDHDTKAAQLEASLSTNRTAQFLTSAETGFINDAARYAIGSKCLHCVSKDGVMALDRFVIQRQAVTELGTELTLEGRLIGGEAIRSLPRQTRTVNVGDHFVVTEAAQMGHIAVHSGGKLAKIPLIGKSFRKEEVHHMVVQRVILFSVTEDKEETAVAMKDRETSEEPQRLDRQVAPKRFLIGPRLRAK